MNDGPHTHRVQIDETYNCYVIRYGDQNSRVGKRFLSCEIFWPPRKARKLNRMIQRRAKRIISRHDKESVKAGTRVISLEAIARDFNQHLITHEAGLIHTKTEWGAEILSKVR